MEKLKIIIIDDNVQKRQTYSDKFRSEGFEVLEAEDGKIGLEMIKSKIPHLIFTGIDMPQMGGFELIQELKKFSPTAKIPVIVSSHLNREEDKKKADALGVDDFIYYGFITLKEVMEKVHAVLKKHRYL